MVDGGLEKPRRRGSVSRWLVFGGAVVASSSAVVLPLIFSSDPHAIEILNSIWYGLYTFVSAAAFVVIFMTLRELSSQSKFTGLQAELQRQTTVVNAVSEMRRMLDSNLAAVRLKRELPKRELESLLCESIPKRIGELYEDPHHDPREAKLRAYNIMCEFVDMWGLMGPIREGRDIIDYLLGSKIDKTVEGILRRSLGRIFSRDEKDIMKEWGFYARERDEWDNFIRYIIHDGDYRKDAYKGTNFTGRVHKILMDIKHRQLREQRENDVARQKDTEPES